MLLLRVLGSGGIWFTGANLAASTAVCLACRMLSSVSFCLTGGVVKAPAGKALVMFAPTVGGLGLLILILGRFIGGGIILLVDGPASLGRLVGIRGGRFLCMALSFACF